MRCWALKQFWIHRFDILLSGSCAYYIYFPCYRHSYKSDILFASYYLLLTVIYYASNGIHTIQKVLLDLVENTCTTTTFPFYSGGFADPVGEVDDFEGWFVQLSVLILSSFVKFTMCNTFHQWCVIYLLDAGLLLLIIFEQSLFVFGFKGLRRCMRYGDGRSRKLCLFSFSYYKVLFVMSVRMI